MSFSFSSNIQHIQPTEGQLATSSPIGFPSEEAAAFAGANISYSGAFGATEPAPTEATLSAATSPFIRFGATAPANPITTTTGSLFGGGGATPAAALSAPSFGFGGTTRAYSPTRSSGDAPSGAFGTTSGGFGFGARAAAAPATSTSSGGFSFGSAPAAASRPVTLSNPFGTPTPAAPSSFGFGSVVTPGFSHARMEARDRLVPSPPSDTVTQLRFSNSAYNPFLIASSWANDVRMWQVSDNGSRIIPRTSLSHAGPVLSCAFGQTAETIFTAGADRTCLMWNVETNTTSVIGHHDAPIKEVLYNAEANIIITGGWDGNIKFWDPRDGQGKPQAVANIGSRVYAMDSRSHLMVAIGGGSTSIGSTPANERAIYGFDLRNGATPTKLNHQLRFQLRSVACFPSADGYVVGSIEGRCAVNNVPTASNDFAFKCHREGNSAWAVNSISFHPVHGTFATAGSDGGICFWDKDARQRLKSFVKDADGNSATSTCFSADGTLFAYAYGYDWSKGANQLKAKGSQIGIHQCDDSETRPRARR